MAVEFGEPLSKREEDVLKELISGASNKQIAESLFISPNTVKVHVRNIRTKLGATSRTDIVAKGLQLGQADDDTTIEPELAPPTPSSHSEPEGAVEPAPTLVETPSESEPISAEIPAPQRSNPSLLLLVSIFLLVALGVGWFVLPQFAEQPIVESEPYSPIELSESGWYEARSAETPISHHTLSSVGADLYMIGGETDNGITNQTWHYSTSTFIWEQRTEKPTPVRDAASAVIQGQIYVVGGETDNGVYTNRTEIYSPLSDQWLPAAALPISAAGGVALSDGGLLYYVGGKSSAGHLATAFVYDPAVSGWRPLPDMTTARSNATGGVLANKLIIVGGSNGDEQLNSCEQFDLTTEIWSACADMLAPRAGASASAIFNQLHVFGGGVQDGSAHGESYDVDRDTWQLLNTPIVNSAESYTYLKTASVETNIYIIGGERDGIKQDSSYIYQTLPFQYFIPSTSKE